MHSVLLVISTISVAALGAVLSFWYRDAKRYKAMRISYANDLKAMSRQLEKIRDDSDRKIEKISMIKREPPKTEYVVIDIHDQTKPEVIRNLAQHAIDPIWLSFMWEMEQTALNRVKGTSDRDEQIRSIHWIEAFDAINSRLAELVRIYNANTYQPQEAEKENGIG